MLVFGVCVPVAPAQSVCRPNPKSKTDADTNSCVNRDGTVDLTVNFRAPPARRHVRTAKRQMRVASDILCDATDGQIELGDIRLTHSNGWQEDADVWWYPQSGRAHAAFGLTKGNNHASLFGYVNCPRPCDSDASPGATESCDVNGDGVPDGCDQSLVPGQKFSCPLNCSRPGKSPDCSKRSGATSCDPDGDGMLELCDPNAQSHLPASCPRGAGTGFAARSRTTSMTGEVIAHELGHLIFELGDQYPERKTGCGQGPSFDGNTFWRTRNHPTAMAETQLLSASPDNNVERNHTIMQQSGTQVCRDETEDFFSYFDKHPDLTFRRNFGCLTDTDCQLPRHKGGWGLGPDWQCIGTPPQQSQGSPCCSAS